MEKDKEKDTNLRYARQTALPEIGMEGQKKLAQAKILIIGVGGLGSPISLYLAGAGAGTIGIADDDNVSESNLQRQILYTESETGLPKVLCAKMRLEALNSGITVIPYRERITEENAGKIIPEYDIIIDGCDNFKTRYILSDICAKLRKPYIFGAISDFTGQIAVLCSGNRTYRDIFPETGSGQEPATVPGAVIGVTPAMAGTIMASEAIKLICGYGETLTDKMLVFDLRDNSFMTVNL